MPARGSHGFQVERDVSARMRDGTLLRADVYRPRGAAPFPVLLKRTPYGKARDTTVDRAERAASFGYLVVIQDVRGRYASEGEFRPGLYRGDTFDAADGYDTVEWAAGLPGSSGKVGTFEPPRSRAERRAAPGTRAVVDHQHPGARYPGAAPRVPGTARGRRGRAPVADLGPGQVALVPAPQRDPGRCAGGPRAPLFPLAPEPHDRLLWLFLEARADRRARL